MKKLLFAAAAAFALIAPVLAEEAKPLPSPGEIVAAAPASDWVTIASSDLLVMDLAPEAKGKARRVVIQLMPAPFSQGWIGNIRMLAAANWWDGTSINRVQDNYVVQWGDATEKKALPDGLVTVPERDYRAKIGETRVDDIWKSWKIWLDWEFSVANPDDAKAKKSHEATPQFVDGYRSYGSADFFEDGWPVGADTDALNMWPTHCYAMVGVGRNLSPDTGSGAELYTVIGHAPRHLDRNIALVGRVIEGIEHLSSLPRGTGALGFYEKEEERVPILSVRIASDMESDKSLPAYEYLSTESMTFAKYADARANRRDPFFNVPAGGADICNIPVPVRRRAK